MIARPARSTHNSGWMLVTRQTLPAASRSTDSVAYRQFTSVRAQVLNQAPELVNC